DRVSTNLNAIRQIQSRVTQQGGTLVLVLTPLLRELDLRELESAGSREYEMKARDRLATFTQDHQIPYLDMLPILSRQTDPAMLYRDHIHFNPQGNQVITEQMIVNLLERAIAAL
ncbi:MAG: SGNH/GDSL hydrolase family protein, partial [Leptolyngbyaceae bacterium]|nr:SGNH/GDSL hydrolase family protein [Leptolyngbyaceae bacterium]